MSFFIVALALLSMPLAFLFTKKESLTDENENEVNLKNFIPFVVNGNYLRPRGINDGDKILFQKIDSFKLIEKIEPNRILLLEINDFDVARIFDGYDDNGLLITHYYDGNGKQVITPINFDKSNVKGVAKYLITSED